MLTRRTHGGRVIGGLLALGWLWVGAVFHGHYFATLNFAAPVYGTLFMLQAGLLCWYGPIRGRLRLRLRFDVPGWVGILVLLYGLVGYPLLDALDGRALHGPRLAGIAAGPTVALTIGLLLQNGARTPLPLLLIPGIWSLVAGFSGWVLDLKADLLLPLAATAAVTSAMWHNRRIRRDPG